MKKTLLLISLFTLSLASFTSCALDNQQSSKVDSNNVLLLQAATGINMIKDVTTFRNARSVETKNTALSEEDTNKIKEILPTVDLLLDNKKTFSSTLEEVNLEIEGNIYQYKETISFLNTKLEEDSYLLYYNIVSTKEENKENEIKEKTYIEGLAFKDSENYYKFFSKTKIEEENEDNEKEVEQKRIFHISVNETSFIEIKEEYEIEENEVEQELKYTVVENDIETLSYSIEIENENNEEEIEIKYDGIKYEVKRTTINDETIYIVKYQDSESKVEATFKKVVDEEGNVQFIVN